MSSKNLGSTEPKLAKKSSKAFTPSSAFKAKSDFANLLTIVSAILLNLRAITASSNFLNPYFSPFL